MYLTDNAMKYISCFAVVFCTPGCGPQSEVNQDPAVVVNQAISLHEIPNVDVATNDMLLNWIHGGDDRVRKSIVISDSATDVPVDVEWVQIDTELNMRQIHELSLAHNVRGVSVSNRCSSISSAALPKSLRSD